MKQLSTLLVALATTMMAWAEAPTLLFQGNPVEDGKTYETGYTVEELDFGDGFVMYSYLQDTELTMKATIGSKVVVEVSASNPVQVCSFGACENVTATSKTGTIDNEITSLDIHKEYESFDPVPVGMTDITVEVKVYYQGSPSDYATAKVILTNRPASEVGGINAVVAPGAKVTLRGNTLDYNMSVPTKLDIYNVNGGLVMSQKVYSTGSISLDSLHPGVYIYSAGIATGKILIRK